MNRPLFSVIIPTLNEELFLPKLLSSLSEQTGKSFEVIVVDGSSKDKTVELAKQFTHKLPKLDIIVSQKASLPLQRNLGSREAQGEWLVFIDADSILLPNFFERIGRFITEDSATFFTTWSRPDSEENADALLTLLQNLMVEGALFLNRPLSPGPLTIIRRDLFEKIGGYDEGRRFHEDMDLSLRASSLGIPFRILRETLYLVSLRRPRKQGVGRVIQQYLLAALPVLFLRKTFKDLPGGYIMGGQLYDKKKRPIKRSVFKKYEIKLKQLVREFLE